MSLPTTRNVAIDLRSDTVTLPSDEMREAMVHAEVGDDVYGEDPTINRLEERVAETLGKEKAIFVPSGTMANLLALLSHCQRGKKIVLGDQSDMWLWEAGGAAVLGGLVYDLVPTEPNGELNQEKLEEAVLAPDDPQCAEPGIICLESTHCMSGGRVLSLDYMMKVRDFAREHDLPLHLDGARFFNAVVAAGVRPTELAALADSVCFCLSKSLGAPAGSMIAGDAAFIDRTRRWRKMLGGGMRQIGILAAAGLFALDRNVERLADDHANARRLYEGLKETPGVIVDAEPPETNIVFWSLADPGASVEGFVTAMETAGVGVGELGRGRIRAVTHLGIQAEHIETVVDAIREVMGSLAADS